MEINSKTLSDSLLKFKNIVPISEIHPYENNPRVNDGAVDAVAESIATFGWTQTIVVDGAGVIICGHSRYKAAKKLGLEQVPIFVADYLSPDKIKAYRVADNRSSELSTWDCDKLKFEMFELSQMGFDMEAYGFSATELAEILGETDPVKAGKTDPDAVPDAPETPASRYGATYQLGAHVLACGDATKLADVSAMMGDSTAGIWITDPPYNVDYEGATEDRMKIMNDSMDDSKFREFLRASFSAAVERMNPGASFYIFHADSEGFNFRGACRDVDLKVRQCLVWRKNGFVLGRQDYQWAHEPCLYGWKDGAAHNWYGDRSQTTVMDFKKPVKNDIHPTMKPVEMLVYLLKNSSKRGDLAIDTFAGSGSTLIACEQTERVARVMELDPKFCDVIRKRWAEFVHGEGCDWESLTPEMLDRNERG